MRWESLLIGQLGLPTGTVLMVETQLPKNKKTTSDSVVLDRCYFSGSDSMRRAIDEGKLSWLLERMKRFPPKRSRSAIPR
jgi:hypothetical protein